MNGIWSKTPTGASRCLPYLCAGLLTAAACSVRSAVPTVTPLGAWSRSLLSPARLAVSADGRTYVSDPVAGHVAVFDAFGRLVETRGGFAGPLGLALDADGHLCLGEQKAGRVTVFDGQWNALYQLGAGDGEFLLPNYIAAEPAPLGRALYVCDSPAHCVKVYTNGQFAFILGAPGRGPGQFDFPTGVFVSGGGEVFVVDQNNDRVQVFSRSGAFQREISLVTALGGMGPGSAGGRSGGITADAAGRLYVTDAFQGFVRVFDAGGAFLGRIGTLGARAGELRTPAAVALDGFNRLLVASPNNGRVDLFGVDSFLHFAAGADTPLVGVGTTVTLSVTAGGAGPFAYQWRRGTNDLADGGPVSGATQATLRLAAVDTNDTGDYSVILSGPSGTLAGPSAALRVLQPPSLLRQPVGQLVAQGANVRLEAVAAGDALQFQWQFNGVDRPGATGPVLDLTDVRPSDSGAYALIARNPVGALTSAVAEVTVLAPPVVVIPPTGRTVGEGSTVQLRVVAEGEALSYQWLFNGEAIPGARSNRLVLPNVRLLDSGAYSVTVSNPVDQVTTPPALLTVVPIPEAPRFEAAERLPAGGVRLWVTGSAGRTYRVQSSPNLVHWDTRTNVVGASGQVQVMVPEDPSQPQRFYRLRWSP